MGRPELLGCSPTLDIHRFRDRDRFASWNGTPPLDASSGNQERHRLSRADNTSMNAHVFFAAQQLGLRRVVWASSETTLGLAYAPPRYAPVDEQHSPYPTSTYALSKVVTEAMAEHISRWSGIPFVGLRFSNIFTEADYAQVPSFQDDPTARMWNLWGYIDVRDAAASCRNALEADTTGSVNLIIANDDTIMERSSADLMADVFPGVEVRGHLGRHDTLLSNHLAKELIGFQPQHGWRV